MQSRMPQFLCPRLQGNFVVRETRHWAKGSLGADSSQATGKLIALDTDWWSWPFLHAIKDFVSSYRSYMMLHVFGAAPWNGCLCGTPHSRGENSSPNDKPKWNSELLVVSQTSPMPHSFGTLRAFALKGLFGKKLVPSNCGNGCKHATRNHMQHQNETAKEKNLRSHLIHTLYHQNSSKFLCTVT